MMWQQRINCLAVMALLFCNGVVQALEYRSVVETGTLFYAAPNVASNKLFVASQYYPLEIMADEKGWSRVRDVAGQLSWVQSAKLSTKRYVLVQVAKSSLRASAAANAPTLATIEKNVALELLAPPVSAWVKVRIDAKTTGYVSLKDVWGI